MDKESIIELQRVDYNCNDCKYLERDINAYNHSKTLHHLWQRQYFDLLNKKKIERAQFQLDNNEWEKALAIIQEVNQAKFAFNNDAHISFGECLKKMIPISFIPNISIPENKLCFQHRRDEPVLNNKL